MKSDKPVIRRTLSQERFEVLIKKQRAGTATFKDLTELDEIVNRVQDIRVSILEEMTATGPDKDTNSSPGMPVHQPAVKLNFPEKVKVFIDRLFRFTPRMAF